MKLIYLVLPFFLLGCSSVQPQADAQLPDLPDSVPGTALALPPANDVRNPEALKAYPIGRYEDPADPFVLHEAHTIYRAEQPATWNLNPTVSTTVPLGPTVAVTDPAKDNSAMTGELEQKIQQQNQLLQATFEQNQRLAEELKKFQDEVAKTHQVLVANDALQKQVTDLQAQVSKLQQDLLAQSHSAPVPAPPPKPADTKSWWQFWTSATPPPTSTINPTPTKGKK